MKRFALPLILMCVLTAGPSAAVTPADDAFGDVFPNLILETVTVEGAEVDHNHLTRILGLRTGDAVDQQDLLDAVERVRMSDLFESVEFFVRPGSQRGRVELVLEVEPKHEQGTVVDVGLGTGVSDVDGWYAIPITVGLSNVLDEQDSLTLRYVMGYRRNGLELAYIQRDVLGSRSWMGVRASGHAIKRVYFHDDLEIGHDVNQTRLSVSAGRAFGRGWDVQLEMGREGVDPDDGATIYRADEGRGLEENEEVPLSLLPADIAGAVDRRINTYTEASLSYNSLSRRNIAHTPASGIRGRLFLKASYHRKADYDIGGASLRMYRSGAGGVFGFKVRGVAVTSDTPFYERPYLGGLYTVRGVPSQSLTRPEGADWLWSSTVEYRKPLSGDSEHPGLSGLLFLDAGRCDGMVSPKGEPVAVGAGWGLRARLFGLLIGVDIGYPLTGSPVDEAFHGNASVGWTF